MIRIHSSDFTLLYLWNYVLSSRHIYRRANRLPKAAKGRGAAFDNPRSVHF